ncbi:MAG: T9SS type A sorting domain-containing protein [Flavobacteriaceae bacterium]|nr:MAG: T9SS type A sorting domain-containing protein [Flavobacteriaceae bacterium]
MKKRIFIGLLLSKNLLFSQSFTDITTVSGIHHIYKQDREMGGGAVFFDFDNDGWEDLYITGGKDKDQLYRNLGNGGFQRITSPWIDSTEDFYTTGVVSGDINNDGYRDLFVTTWRGENNNGPLQRNLLFMNNGNGTFSELGNSYGLTEIGFSMGAAILDYNRDGLLDIYVVNYIENSVAVFDDITGEVTGFDHDCYANLFYKNNGNGTFTEMAATLGLNNSGCALAVMATDFDMDNDSDIYIANDFGEFVVTNTMLENNYPVNSFSDVSVTTNMNVGIYGMGIAYADFDKDQDFDYYITNLGKNVLIQNDGNQNFTDIITATGVENIYAENSNNTLYSTSWGAAFLDINNDTWPDLFVANGRIPAASFIATGEDDPNKLFINNGDMTFTDISDIAEVNDYNRGRGMAYCDYDKDGDLDMIVVVQDGTASTTAKTVLYQNQINPNGSDGKNWTQIKLEGTNINKDAIGARVELTVNGEKLIQEVHGQGSHCSQHSLILHFGLGSHTVIDKLKVIWSSTDTQTFMNLDANTRFNLVQGATLSTPDGELFSIFSTYPNPVKDMLWISGIDQEHQVKVYSVYGKLLKKESVTTHRAFVDMTNYKTGIYIMKFIDQNGVTKRNQLIVKE